MRRYARELARGMAEVAGPPEIQIVPVAPSRPRFFSRLSSHPSCRRIDAALGRYAVYPVRAAFHAGTVFHVLDHGYAQVGRFLPPERLVVTCHDLIPLLASLGLIPVKVPASVRVSFRYRLKCMARAAKIITDSDATRRTLIEHTPICPERVEVIHLGLSRDFKPITDTSAVRCIRAKHGLPTDVKIVLQVASKGRYKNTEAVLRAVAAVKARSLPAILVRVGEPFHDEERRLCESLGLTPFVRQLGRLADDRSLAEIYASADVLAFPSHWEGFGWPPLEAMACGLPVVASNTPAVAEIVGRAGLLVAPTDYAGLASAMAQILTDHETRAELIAKGLARAAMFDWRECARRTLRVYSEVERQHRSETAVQCARV